jgi:hypothetical protein
MTASFFSGARLIWLVNKASWSVVTAQVSPFCSSSFSFLLFFFFLSISRLSSTQLYGDYDFVLMKGTCNGYDLDFNDCSITTFSCFDLPSGGSRVGLVGRYECLSLIAGRSLESGTKGQHDSYVDRKAGRECNDRTR